MKVSAFPAVITFLLASIIGYLAYHISDGHNNANAFLIGIGASISVIVTLGCLIACSLENKKMNMNMKAWSSLTFIVLIIANFCFAIFTVDLPFYLVTIVILILVHLYVVWKLSNIDNV